MNGNQDVERTSFRQDGRWQSDSSVLARDISDPAKSRVANRAGFAAFPHSRRTRRQPVHVALAGVHQWQIAKQAAAFLVPAVGDKRPTSLRTAAAGLATTRCRPGRASCQQASARRPPRRR